MREGKCSAVGRAKLTGFPCFVQILSQSCAESVNIPLSRVSLVSRASLFYFLVESLITTYNHFPPSREEKTTSLPQ